MNSTTFKEGQSPSGAVQPMMMLKIMILKESAVTSSYGFLSSSHKAT
jgi:hypothetical protein